MKKRLTGGQRLKQLLPISVALIILVILSAYFLFRAKSAIISGGLSIPTSSPVTNQESYSSLNDIPECDKAESTLSVETWKTYTDNYNKFNILLPSTLALFKGPGDYMTDEEYQKQTFRPNQNAFKIDFSSNMKQPLSVWVKLNDSECTDLDQCFTSLIANTISPYSISCKVSKKLANGTYLFIRINMIDSLVGQGTYWITFVNSSRGLLEISFGNKGKIDYPYYSEYSKIVESFKFTK